MRQCIPPHFDHACEFRCRNAFGMVFFRGAATCSVGICIVDVVSALRCLRAEVFTNCVGSAFFSSRPFVHSPCLPAFVETCLVPLPLLLQRFRILASLREAHAKARYRRGSVNVAFTIIPDDLLEDVFKNKACDGHGGGRGLESLQDAGWDAPETPSDARVWAISGAPPICIVMEVHRRATLKRPRSRSEGRLERRHASRRTSDYFPSSGSQRLALVMSSGVSRAARSPPPGINSTARTLAAR